MAPPPGLRVAWAVPSHTAVGTAWAGTRGIQCSIFGSPRAEESLAGLWCGFWACPDHALAELLLTIPTVFGLAWSQHAGPEIYGDLRLRWC